MEYNSIKNYPLSQDKIGQLNRMMKEDDSPSVRNRAHAIILLFDDYRRFEDVAEILRVHANTVRNWAERWVSEGVEGLYDLEGRGAKPIFSKKDEKIILECLEQEPRSLRKVADMVEKITGKKASIGTYRRILKNHRKSWKRQRKIVKDKPDEKEYKQAKADIEELKKMACDGEFDLVYFDETGVSLTPCVPYAWQDIGREGTLGIPASHSKQINLLGFMKPTPNELTVFEHVGSVNSEFIINVMDEFCDSLTTPTVVILDNASIHASKAVAAKKEDWEQRGLTLYFLSRYSPQLNSIEILWRKIKYEWMPVSAYESMGALKIALRNILQSFGSDGYKIQFS
ncbi:MAG TPA: IS630 family transposase [Archaeoglobaceae archaeon]|nr:IS630 family transposase [Archaeoglobaceae archaeon]